MHGIYIYILLKGLHMYMHIHIEERICVHTFEHKGVTQGDMYTHVHARDVYVPTHTHQCVTHIHMFMHRIAHMCAHTYISIKEVTHVHKCIHAHMCTQI